MTNTKKHEVLEEFGKIYAEGKTLMDPIERIRKELTDVTFSQNPLEIVGKFQVEGKYTRKGPREYNLKIMAEEKSDFLFPDAKLIVSLDGIGGENESYLSMHPTGTKGYPVFGSEFFYIDAHGGNFCENRDLGQELKLALIEFLRDRRDESKLGAEVRE